MLLIIIVIVWCPWEAVSWVEFVVIRMIVGKMLLLLQVAEKEGLSNEHKSWTETGWRVSIE